MTKKTKDELQVRNREIQDRLSEMNDVFVREQREMTDDESREWKQLSRERELNVMQIESMMTDEELAARPQQPLRRQRVVSKSLRAYAQSVSSADKGGVRLID